MTKEERQGRHRYLRLANPTVAALIEDLSSYSPTTATPKNLRESARMSAEARARTCYDHLAGHLGVAISDAILDRASSLTARVSRSPTQARTGSPTSASI